MRSKPVRSAVVLACCADVGLDLVPLSLVAALAGHDVPEHRLAEWAPAEHPPDLRLDDAQVAAVREGVVRLVGDAAASAALWAGVDDLEARPAVVAWPGPFGGRRRAVEWAVGHRPVLLAGVRMAAVAGLGRRGCALARSLWALTGVIESWRMDAGWRAELAEWGERAARGWSNAAALAGLVERSAALAEDVDDFLTAERQWVRALALWREIHDEPRVVAVHESLIRLFVRWGRLHRAMDVAFELVATHGRHGAGVEQARALTTLAELMARAGRPESAAGQLQAAIDIYRSLGRPRPVEHARALVQAGRVEWDRRATAAARRFFHTALGLVVEVDEQVADHIRALLKTPSGEELPACSPRSR